MFITDDISPFDLRRDWQVAAVSEALRMYPFCIGWDQAIFNTIMLSTLMGL